MTERQRRQQQLEAALFGEDDSPQAAFWIDNQEEPVKEEEPEKRGEYKKSIPKKERKTVATQVLLTPSNAEKLQQIKEQTGQSKNAIINYLIEQYRLKR